MKHEIIGVLWRVTLGVAFGLKILGGGCYSMNTASVVEKLRGGGDTQTLPAVIEFALNFLHSAVEAKKHLPHACLCTTSDLWKFHYLIFIVFEEDSLSRKDIDKIFKFGILAEYMRFISKQNSACSYQANFIHSNLHIFRTKIAVCKYILPGTTIST